MKIETNAFCPDCGPDVSTDEEGCCSACGATATGTAVVSLARRLAALERVVEAVKRWRHVPPDLYAIKTAVDDIDTALAALDAKEVGRGN